MNLISTASHFYIADLHFGDPYVFDISKRPFSCVEEMDEVIVDRWNAVVGPRDLVWLLGDVTTDTGPSEHLARLNGSIHLIAGNHDTCFAGYTPNRDERERAVAQYLAAGVRFVNDGASMARRHGRPTRIPLRPGLAVDLSHFPYDPDPWRPADEPDPWTTWRPRRPRSGPEPWLIHGHVHVAERHVIGRQVNVAADMWDFTPVAAEVIAGLIDSAERGA